MSRTQMLAALLAVSAGLVVAAVFLAFGTPAGLAGAGVALAAWSWLVVGEVDDGTVADAVVEVEE